MLDVEWDVTAWNLSPTGVGFEIRLITSPVACFGSRKFTCQEQCPSV
jgi:hypothetical protein